MKWFDSARVRLRLLFARRAAESRMNDEFRFHIEMETDQLARAKGLAPWRIMWTYAGRNAILPNLTGFAMSLGFVVSGAILVEFVFNYPGVGWMFLQSVENQDYALMQALFLLITVAVLIAILAADGATAILDPRTRDRA